MPIIDDLQTAISSNVTGMHEVSNADLLVDEEITSPQMIFAWATENFPNHHFSTLYDPQKQSSVLYWRQLDTPPQTDSSDILGKRPIRRTYRKI